MTLAGLLPRFRPLNDGCSYGQVHLEHPTLVIRFVMLIPVWNLVDGRFKVRRTVSAILFVAKFVVSIVREMDLSLAEVGTQDAGNVLSLAEQGHHSKGVWPIGGVFNEGITLHVSGSQWKLTKSPDCTVAL